VVRESAGALAILLLGLARAGVAADLPHPCAEALAVR